KRVISNILMPFVTVFNLRATPIRIVISTVKLVTEFLPALISSLLYVAAKYVNKRINISLHYMLNQTTSVLLHSLLNTFAFILKGCVYLPFAAVKLIHVIGRSFTSPFTSAKIGWKYGKSQWGQPVGFILASLSLLVSFSFYAVVFPIIIKTA